MSDNPLVQLKDVLENMKGALTLIAEAKLKNIENIKSEFSSMVELAQKMEMEKNLIDTIDKVKQDSNEIKIATSNAIKTIKSYI